MIAKKLILSSPTGAQVRASRIQAGFTQKKMAEAIGAYKNTTISQIECGYEIMSGARWSLWLLLVGQHPHHVLIKRL